MQFTNYAGKTVFQCHILNHEDWGMMATLQIVE
jgi:FtsP/CotA-like multicopper oxidase with cupredoxin domain